MLCLATTSLLSGQILYDNGTVAGGSGFAGLVTPSVTGFGGAPASVLQGTSTLLGAGHQISAFNRVADDFTVSGGVLIDSLKFFAYQTGSTTTSTINDVRVRIYNGPPNAGGVVIYGDTTTNRLSSTSWSGIYRTGSTTPTDANRPIMTVKVNISPALNLAAGTYWIEWNCGGTLASGPWAPGLNHNTAFGAGNAIQHTSTTFTWAALQDAGSATQLGVPFIVYGVSACSITATTSSTDAVCANNGTASVTATSGTGPYTYNWSNGQTTATATGLAAGSYTVQVIDTGGGGCSTNQTVTVASSSITVSATTTTTPSACGSATGTATVSPTNGTSPYTYLWSNGQTNATATGLGVGFQNVTITDANSCSGQIMGIQITNAGGPAASISNSTNVLCNGNSNGSATVSGTGGTMPYSYLWSNSQTTDMASGLAAGTYYVTITDAASCISTTSVTITQPSALTGSTAITTNISCNGAGDGEATVSPSGGTSPYAFAWGNGQTAATATGLSAGPLGVVITDANGCTHIPADVTLTEPTAVNVSTPITTIPSSAGATDGSIALTGTGGTSPYTYNWSDGQNTATATGLGVGTYDVTITDANGCEFVVNNLNMPDGPTALVTNNNNLQINLFPNPADKMATLQISLNSSADLNIQISNVTGQILRSINDAQVTNAQYQLDLTDFPAGVYFVKVMTANHSGSYRLIKE